MTDRIAPEHKGLLDQLNELHLALQQNREYHLEMGKWNPQAVINLLEVRRVAVEKTIEAVKLGYNRGTIVETLLHDLGISPIYPMF